MIPPDIEPETKKPKMDRELWHNINNLLSLLNQFKVVLRVRKYYAQYGNAAPPSLLQEEMDALQKKLDQE